MIGFESSSRLLVLMLGFSIALTTRVAGAQSAGQVSPVVAKLDVRDSGATMTGELRFNLNGGELKGQADLAVAAPQDDGPDRTSGSAANGRFEVHLELDGFYTGGLFGATRGAAKLSGTFTDEVSCQAKLEGSGVFTGSISAPLGIATLTPEWDSVRFDGCNLVSPQPFFAVLPQFNFPETEQITGPPAPAPVLATAVARAPTVVALAGSPPLVLDPAPTAAATDAGWGGATMLVAIFTLAAVGGGLFLAMRRRPPVRSAASSAATPAAPANRTKRGERQCSKCRAVLASHARFCGKCGRPV